MDKKKKILIIVMAIIIIAGCIVVGVKGFNVSLYLRNHDTLEYIFSEQFQKKDVKNACKEVFGDKKFEVRTREVFQDSVYIIAENISEDEEKALLEKLVALYQNQNNDGLDTSNSQVVANLLESAANNNVEAGTTITYDTEDGTDSTSTAEKLKTVDDLTEGTDYQLYHDSKIRLRDLLTPYILPTAISAVIIIACMMIRYKLLKSEKIIKKTLEIIGQSILLLLVLLSLVAILRIPVNAWILPGMMLFALLYIVFKFEFEIRKNEEIEEK